VDQTSAQVQTETQKPQNQKHHKNCPKHSHILLLLASTPKEFSYPQANLEASMKLLLTVFFIHDGNTVQDCSSRARPGGSASREAFFLADRADRAFEEVALARAIVVVL
jgi:hypothetical protein